MQDRLVGSGDRSRRPRRSAREAMLQLVAAETLRFFLRCSTVANDCRARHCRAVGRPKRREVTMNQKARDRLLTCGVFAGPLFVAVVVVQALTRDGYDLGE